MKIESLSTPILRYLEQYNVDYQLLPHHTPAISIEDAAQQRGINTEQMVKCLLLRDMSDRLALACVPGNRHVDPKKVRAHLNWRRMTCVAREQVEVLTGYTVGTVTPLCLKKSMPILFDPTILRQTIVTISSGSPLAGIALWRDDLLHLCQPIMANIVREP